MQALLEKVYLTYFKTNGYYYAESEKNKPGYSFCLDNDLGQGSYWVYPVNDWFAITSYNTKYKTRFTSNNFNPVALGLGLSCASNAKDWFGGTSNGKRQLVAVCGDDSTIELKVESGDYVNTKGVVLLPEYYKKRIEPIARQSFDDFNNILTSIVSSGRELPEFWQLIDSLSNLSYDSSCIDLVLEGKILSIVGTILTHQESLM